MTDRTDTPPMDRRRRHERRKSAASADIGALPPPKDQQRRDDCEFDLLLFLVTYFPHSTGASPFSGDHKRVIARIQSCLLHGGRFCNAVYRGFAKTTISELAALWAILYGHRKFVLALGADKAAAKGIVASVLAELCENDLLAEDFPEVCLAFQALDGRSQRAFSQTHNGRLTHLRMSGDTLVLPTIWNEDGTTTPGSGGIIRGKGLLAAVRGMKYKRPDGTNQRVDFVIGDDIQTDASARNPIQCKKRIDIVIRGVLKSAGHTKSIACVINATVVALGDAIEQLLDPDQHASFQGERIKMVRRWADAHETLWVEYARIRQSYDRSDPNGQANAAAAATEFYRKHREEMDFGADVSWEHCFDPECELSAIQHAYNFWIDDGPDVFASECQNEPLRAAVAGLEPLDAPTLAKRISGYARGVVPFEADVLTCFVDVHGDVLYWVVCAWKMDFTGWVVDYGTWPDQQMAYFTKRQAKRTLRRKYPGIGAEGAIIKGLSDLTDHLCTRIWIREQSDITIGKLLIDKGWGTPEVEHVCRTSPHKAIMMPSRGVGIRAADCPISEYKTRKGRILGGQSQWYVESGGGALRYVRFDTNFWKTRLHARLTCTPTTPGALLLFGDKKSDHRMIADHVVGSEGIAEKPGQGRTILEWTPIPGRDNHLLDGLVGCSVAASLLGCSLSGDVARKAVKTRRQRAIEAAKRKGLVS